MSSIMKQVNTSIRLAQLRELMRRNNITTYSRFDSLTKHEFTETNEP